MLENLVMFATASYGGSFGRIFASWQNLGVFDFLLPFLIIFCLVFVVLSGLKLFKDNKPINIVISLAIGLMAMSIDFVPRFFQELFPRMGIGLSLILVLLILIGMFWPHDENNKGLVWGFIGGAAIIFLVVVFKSFNAVGWDLSLGWGMVSTDVISLIGLIVLVIVAVASTREKDPSAKSIKIPLTGTD